MSRQIVLDTETTGLDPKSGHRIIEIGCVELVNRRHTGRNFHCYLQPDRDVDPGAFRVHGISNDFLADKPRFTEIVAEFLEFIDGAELVIHNAPFDVGFLNAELGWYGEAWDNLESHCQIMDTLALARSRHPGQKNNLDALCRRYDVNNTERTLHGALLDAKILADVYLAMTGEQFNLALAADEKNDEDQAAASGAGNTAYQRRRKLTEPLLVLSATAEELTAHQQFLAKLEQSADDKPLWYKIES